MKQLFVFLYLPSFNVVGPTTLKLVLLVLLMKLVV